MVYTHGRSLSSLPTRRLLVTFLGALSLWSWPTVAPGQAQVSAVEVDEFQAMASEIRSFDAVDVRSREAIDQELEIVGRMIDDIDARLLPAGPVEAAAKGRLQPKQKAIDATKADLDLAKKEKREADALRLDLEKKKLDAELKFLGRVAEMRTAQLEWLKKSRAFAEARKKALDLEMLVADRRTALRELPQDDPSAAVRLSELREFEKEALAAMAESAERGVEAADRKKNVVEKQLKVQEAIAEYAKLP